MESGHHAVINATNPTLRRRRGGGAAGDAQHAPHGADRRSAVLPGARAQLPSRAGRDDGRARARRRLRRRVRGAGHGSAHERPRPAPARDGDRVRFRVRRARTASSERRSSSSAPRRRGSTIDERRARVVWDVELGPREAVTLLVTVDPGATGGAAEAPAMERRRRRLSAAHGAWEGACARITTDNELFDRFIDASIRDLHALMSRAGRRRCRPRGSLGTSRRSGATRCWPRARR